MISVASDVDGKMIERFHHLDTFFVSGENGWRKGISREEQESVLTVFLPQLGKLSFEIDDSAFILFGLNIVDIVKVEECNERFD
jgi:hypothetical protein